MKRFIKTSIAIAALLIAFSFTASAQEATAKRYVPEPYVPADHELYKTIAKMDSLYFDTYNHSKLAEMDSLTAEDIEFYHDRTGLMTSKKDLLDAMQKNIFGKVTRTLAPGSLEVYEIKGFGAVEMGYHKFFNNQDPGPGHFSKFVIIWRLKGNKWQITRVISLH